MLLYSVRACVCVPFKIQESANLDTPDLRHVWPEISQL